MSDPIATPIADLRSILAQVAPPAGLQPSGLADLLAFLPDRVANLPRRDIQTSGDSATAIYLAGEEGGRPDFGMVVALRVAPQDDAAAMVATIQLERWGDPADHTVTAEDAGSPNAPAFREFWRVFPPGLFALPNTPIYFLIFYRTGSDIAFMLIATSPAIRSALVVAVGEALRG